MQKNFITFYNIHKKSLIIFFSHTGTLARSTINSYDFLYCVGQHCKIINRVVELPIGIGPL